MSRSNPTIETIHPCRLWLEWKGGVGHMSHWDKTKGENGERVVIDVDKKPFRCIYLCSTVTVRGYSKVRKSGVYANEIPDRSSDTLTVRFFDGKEIIASGPWQAIKDAVTSKRVGGGFCKNVYIAYKDGAELKIGCLLVSGCALGPWIEFTDKHRKQIEEKGFSIARGPQEENGGVDFFPPIFTLCEITPETDMAAKKLDVELQAFLAEYFAKQHAPQSGAAPAQQQVQSPTGRSKSDEEREADEQAEADARVNASADQASQSMEDVPF